MCHSEVCAYFCVHSRASGAYALFLHYLIVAHACATFVSLVHANFLTSCIVLCLLEMHFMDHG
jgi:hypothetical protein